MITRTFLPAVVEKQTAPYANETVGFNAQEWLSNPRNVALVNQDGDVGLFQYDRPGVYYGHYFFSSRGKKAVKAAREMLRIAFSSSAEIIQGVTPVDKLGARWLSRHLGFKSFDIIDTSSGPCELFVLTKKDFLDGPVVLGRK